MPLLQIQSVSFRSKDPIRLVANYQFAASAGIPARPVLYPRRYYFLVTNIIPWFRSSYRNPLLISIIAIGGNGDHVLAASDKVKQKLKLDALTISQRLECRWNNPRIGGRIPIEGFSSVLGFSYERIAFSRLEIPWFLLSRSVSASLVLASDVRVIFGTFNDLIFREWEYSGVFLYLFEVLCATLSSNLTGACEGSRKKFIVVCL